MKRFIKICLSLLIFGCPVGDVFCQPGTALIRDVAFLAEWDGTEQRYVLMLPDAQLNQDRYDLIIGLHGHGSDRWQFATDERAECKAFREVAAAHQMIAVSPDYRAKTSWMGPAAEQDLVQIIHALKQEFPVGRVFIVGASMGGTSALTFSVLHPDLVDGVVSMNGHANHLEYENFQDSIAASFGAPKNIAPEEYKKRSAEYWPERLTMPIAITAGLEDTVVPPGSVIRLANVLKLLDGEVFLNVDSVGGHETNFEDAYTAITYVVSKNRQKKIDHGKQ